MMLVRAQLNVHSLLPEFLTRADVFQMSNVILENDVTFKWQAKPFRKGFLPQVTGSFIEIRSGSLDPAACVGEAVVIDDESALVVEDVGIGEDVFIHAAIGAEKVIEEELLHVRKQGTAVKDREDLPVVSSDKAFVGLFVHFRLAELHPIFFAEAFDPS